MVHKIESGTHRARRGLSPRERTQGEEKAEQKRERQKPMSEMEAKAGQCVRRDPELEGSSPLHSCNVCLGTLNEFSFLLP